MRAGLTGWFSVLEFGPRNAVLAWANQVVANYPDRRVILLTHTHIYADNTLHGRATNHLWTPTSYGRANNGTDVWNKLLRLHPNTAFAFNGHVLLSGTGTSCGHQRLWQPGLPNAGKLPNTRRWGRRLSARSAVLPGTGQPEREDLFALPQFMAAGFRKPVHLYQPGRVHGAGPGYLIDPAQASASLIITNDDLSLYPPKLVSGSYLGVPPVFTSLTFNVPLDPVSALALANYSLSDGTPLVAVRLSPDLTRVSLTADSNLGEGRDYELAIGNLQTLDHGIAMTNPVVWPFTYRSLIMADDFSAENLNAYTIVDEGILEGPSSWVEDAGRLVQWSNIYGPIASALDHRRGTFAVWNAPDALNWSDYAASVWFRNDDDDGVGLLFRYQNRSNYYKVELDSQRSFRKLFRVVGGVETTLAAETNGYALGKDYQLQVMVTNNVIQVRLNGRPLFGGPVVDSSLSAGTVALYSWGSVGLIFSNLTVTPAPPFPPPAVVIASPAPDAVFAESAAIPISISATDTDGTIVKWKSWMAPTASPPFLSLLITLNGRMPRPGTTQL